jgi:peptidyl-prolyl cis-trans isomerase B (cyclophilin B)
VSRLPALSLILAVLLLAAGCGGDDESDSASAAPAETEATTTGSTNGCQDLEQPEPRDGGEAGKPKGKLAPARRYDVKLVTTCDLTFRLNLKTAPNAAASFVSLARGGFFDDTIFHRIVPGIRHPGW